MSFPEVLLWRELKNRPGNLKFRRQHPFGRYILDFYCDVAKLVVEIDGEAHDRGEQPKRDAERDQWLASEGLTVLRIPAKDVLANLDGVLRYIVALTQRPKALNPPPPGEGDREAVEGETQ